MGGQIKKLPLLFLLFLVLSGLELVSVAAIIPLLSSFIFEHRDAPAAFDFLQPVYEVLQDSDLFFYISSIIALLFTVKAFSTIYISAIITKFAQGQRVLLGARLLNSLLDQPLIRFLDKSEADGIYDLQASTGAFFTYLQAVLKFFSECFFAFCLICLLAYVDFISFLICFAFLGCILSAYLLVSQKQILKLGIELNDAESLVIRTSADVIRAYREIKIYGKRELFVSTLKGVMGRTAKVALWLNVHSFLPRQILEVAIVSLLLISVSLVQIGAVEKSTVLNLALIYAVVLLRLMPLMSSLTALVNRMKSLRDSMSRLSRMLGDVETPSKLRPRHNVSGLLITKLETIQFSRVSFSYPRSEKVILNDVSLQIAPGGVFGLIGASGGGKTTLLNLIAGLLVPCAGKVEINGSKISDIEPKSRGLAYVPQETVLISGSILDNVTLINNPSDDEKKLAVEACKLACVDDLIETFPEGMETKIGVGGITISGGQKQRLAIARAVFQRRPVLILDEATNALDEALERDILENLIDCHKDGAIILVSHRNSVLDFCSSVIKISDGKIKC